MCKRGTTVTSRIGASAYLAQSILFWQDRALKSGTNISQQTVPAVSQVKDTKAA